MPEFMNRLGDALLLAFGMFWTVGWSLVLGFAISAVLQAVVSQDAMRRTLGRGGAREIALATVAGAASSSCSYASAAVSRTLFKRGAALIPSLAFLFASTNLVVELGIVLYLLMGWQFALGEWVGGVVLILVMSLLVRLTYPAKLVEAARRHPENGRAGHDHGGEGPSQPKSLRAKLRDPQTRIRIAQNFVMDWGMLWKDLALGFLIAGALAAFVPDNLWQTLFMKGSSPIVQIPVNAAIGPIVAVISFVCSIGNVPMAAVLWGAGVSFGGVLAFLYADLIVLPLLDVYRRYYGWRMATYIALVFYATMVLSAIIMDLAFSGLGLIPARNPGAGTQMAHVSLNYTFWLNIIFGALAAWLFVVARRHPMTSGHCEHHGHGRTTPAVAAGHDHPGA
jgi:uncharacterized membrane protein YraQ (UPF0718 family)